MKFGALIPPRIARSAVITLALMLGLSAPWPSPTLGSSSAPQRTMIWFASTTTGRTALRATQLQSRRGSLISELGSKVVFAPQLSGFVVANLTAQQQVALASDPRVVAMEPDVVMHATVDEVNPPWGLDRIDQSALPLNARYNVPADGAGVDVYVIDTGVDAAHVAFGGRVEAGVDFVGDGYLPTQDPMGHGTHVAGTAAGNPYGIAQGAEIIPVRVLNAWGSGYFSWMVAGIDWTVASAAARKRPAVVNISAGASGIVPDAIAAVSRATAAGVVVVTAAGNNADNACNFTPGGAAESAITVAATSSDDSRTFWSNSGSCVDLFAPGDLIPSARAGGGSVMMSGTSMAAPHVTGVAALLRGLDPTATPAQITQELIDASTKGVVTDPNGSPNRLLHISCLGAPCPVTPPGTSQHLSVGTTLYGISSVWERALSTSFSFYRCTVEGGATTSVPGDCVQVSTGPSYQIDAADYGRFIRRIDVATNLVGSTVSASETSNAILTMGRMQDPLELSGAPATLLIGERATLGSTGGTSTGAVSAVSRDESVCSTTGLTVVAVGAGTCTVFLRKAEDALYAAVDSADTSITVLIPPSVPSITSDPQIVVTPVVGRGVSASTGTWLASPSPSLSYQWYRCTSVGAAVTASSAPSRCTKLAGATSATYVPSSSDYGKLLRIAVKALNTFGALTRFSATSPTVASVPYKNSAPTISGTAKMGRVMTARTGTFGGSTPMTYAYQWFSCTSRASTGLALPIGCVAINTPLVEYMTLTGAQVGRYVLIAVTATNDFGSLTQYSATSSAIR